MNFKISPKKYWEENISLLMVCMGFIDLLSEQIHEAIKWPMLGLGIVALLCCYIFHKVDKRISIVIFLVILLSVIEVAFSEGILPSQYIWDIGICMPIALCIYYARNVSPKKWIILYIIVTLFLLYRLFVTPDHYSVLYSHSRNYISVFIIFLLFMIAVNYSKKCKKLPIWLYYATTITCIIAIGRGGVLAGLLLFALYILYDIKIEEKSGNKYAKLILLFAGMLVAFVVFVLFQDAVIQKFFPRFAGTGLAADSSNIAVSKRILMWVSYISESFSSLKLFVLGVDPYPIVLRINYRNDFNLHNSYVMTHVFYGVFGLLGVIICIVKFAKKLFKGQEFELLIIFLCFVFRSIFDHCFPGKLSAVIIWIAIFYTVGGKHRSNRGRIKKNRYEHNIQITESKK